MYGSAKHVTQLPKQDSFPKVTKVVPLTEEQREAIKQSHKKLAESAAKYGNELFIRLFSDFPDYKDIWPRFRALPDSSLVGSDQMRSHASVYMKGIETIVSKIDDDVALQEVLRKIASSHVRFNITKAHVEHMVPCLLEVLRLSNGSISDETRAAWTRLYDNFGEILAQLSKERGIKR
ncbi:unnamed protein product, partial [Mesorhabditis belari]|uniref:Globin family profile domain-containing protein n=1 Tax=Mesorhabditis belari TaxID=2138241 RepID=A0AAF3FHN4_9BILA